MGFLQCCTSLKPGLCCYRGKLNCLERDTLALHSQCRRGKAGPGNKARIIYVLSLEHLRPRACMSGKQFDLGPETESRVSIRLTSPFQKRRLKQCSMLFFMQNMKKGRSSSRFIQIEGEKEVTSVLQPYSDSAFPSSFFSLLLTELFPPRLYSSNC